MGALCAFLLTATGCHSESLVRASVSGSSTLIVRNASSTMMTNITVIPDASGISVTAARLDAGQSMAPFSVPSLHDNPVVRATVNGQALVLQPVEGFSGFNPKRPPGRYEARLGWSSTNGLSVSIVSVE